MLKIDMTSFAGSMVATIVMKTTNVNKIVKANDARSPDVTGMQNTSKFTKLKSIIGTTGWSIRLLVNIYTKYKMTCACTNTRKQKENNTTKTNEDRMSEDNNSENQDLREIFEIQTISKLSMETFRFFSASRFSFLCCLCS
jgi:hypothetical protein